jgi:uncharacterized membrane protein
MQTKETDLRMEIAIGHMLRVGVTTAAIIVLAGAILYLAHAAGPAPNYRVFHGEVSSPLNLAPVFDGIRNWKSDSIIQLGILVLIATPIVRVLFCVVGFAAQKDSLYVAVSGTVLAVLLYSFIFRS